MRSTPSTGSWCGAIRTCSATESAETAGDVKRIWGEVKAAEKKAKGREAADAARAACRARCRRWWKRSRLPVARAGVGFDWENPEQVIEKLDEELAEFAEARRKASPDELEDELGDMLFVLVNLARFVKVDPEQALRRSNAKFRRRFGYIEQKLAEQGKRLQEADMAGNGGAVAGGEERDGRA